MTPVFAAILGALLAGAFQTILRVLDRRSHRMSLLRALKSEIGTLCEVIKIQRYVELYTLAAADVQQGKQAIMMPIDATQNYFTMYEGIGSDIGLLSERDASAIVEFYTLAKIAIDTARPGSQFSHAVTLQNLMFMRGVAVRLLALGDHITGQRWKTVQGMASQ